MTEKKSPLDQALDLFLYAPLGLAIVARDELPKLIERGRQQVNGQMTMARMMGEYAVKQEGPKLVRRAQERLSGLAGPPVSSNGTARPPAAPGAAATATSTPSAAASPPAAASTPAPAPAASTPPPAPPRPAADLAIPGYDALSASQVVTRLAGLSPDELEAVRTYELGTRHRKTILSRISQLQTA